MPLCYVSYVARPRRPRPPRPPPARPHSEALWAGRQAYRVSAVTISTRQARAGPAVAVSKPPQTRAYFRNVEKLGEVRQHARVCARVHARGGGLGVRHSRAGDG
jgi:hypothetical protein